MKKVIVFDFDGVITIRGEELKQQAWDELAKDRSDDFKKRLLTMRLALSDGKGDRDKILQDTYSALSEYSKEEIPALVKKDSERYNKVVQELIFADGMHPETKEALEKLKAAGYELYINSATPEDPVIESCQRLGIDRLFKGIYGQPKTKVENLERIANEARIHYSDILFVGDSSGDLESARKFGCSFIGVANDFNKWYNVTSYPTVNRLTDLLPIVGIN